MYLITHIVSNADTDNTDYLTLSGTDKLKNSATGIWDCYAYFALKTRFVQTFASTHRATKFPLPWRQPAPAS